MVAARRAQPETLHELTACRRGMVAVVAGILAVYGCQYKNVNAAGENIPRANLPAGHVEYPGVEWMPIETASGKRVKLPEEFHFMYAGNTIECRVEEPVRTGDDWRCDYVNDD